MLVSWQAGIDLIQVQTFQSYLRLDMKQVLIQTKSESDKHCWIQELLKVHLLGCRHLFSHKSE